MPKGGDYAYDDIMTILSLTLTLDRALRKLQNDTHKLINAIKEL